MAAGFALTDALLPVVLALRMIALQELGTEHPNRKRN